MTVSEIDIWRAAKLLIDHHGTQAAMQAAFRANSALEQGDLANYETWQWIAMTIVDFERPKIQNRESVH